MAYLPGTLTDVGSFLGTTTVWDAQIIENIDVNSQEFKDLLVELYTQFNKVLIELNGKVSAKLPSIEFVSGKIYANPNGSNDLIPGFTKSFTIGALGPGVTAINHNIAVDANLRWISIVGAATDNVGMVGYPITFGGAAGNNIGVTTSATQIIINNASGVAFSSAYVTVEYVKY